MKLSKSANWKKSRHCYRQSVATHVAPRPLTQTKALIESRDTQVLDDALIEYTQSINRKS
nr:hypothetical protein [Vibrio neptunius]